VETSQKRAIRSLSYGAASRNLRNKNQYTPELRACGHVHIYFWTIACKYKPHASKRCSALDGGLRLVVSGARRYELLSQHGSRLNRGVCINVGEYVAESRSESLSHRLSRNKRFSFLDALNQREKHPQWGIYQDFWGLH
jgi:hypothetical protein